MLADDAHISALLSRIELLPTLLRRKQTAAEKEATKNFRESALRLRHAVEQVCHHTHAPALAFSVEP